MRTSLVLGLGLLAGALPAQLFTGVDQALPMRSSTLANFPTVTYASGAPFAVNGMASLDDGRSLLVCTGAFTTDIYRSVLGGTPTLLVRSSVDLHGMGFGRNTLFGFTNFSSPLGVRSIDLTTGANTVVADTSATGYRFFGLDYNATDDRLYGYTEYGAVTGLYAIDIDTGACTFVAPSIPAVNTQGRGLACGNHIVHLTGTRGLDGVDYYAYDLRQGTGGLWQPFTNPFTTTNATGGSAFLETRQANLQLRGEGRVTLSCTGAPLQTGRTSTFRIHSDLPHAQGALLLSLGTQPTFVPALNATMVQWPPSFVSPLSLDGNGMFELTIPGGGGPVSFYVQYLMVDPRTPTSWAVSNALKVDFLP